MKKGLRYLEDAFTVIAVDRDGCVCAYEFTPNRNLEKNRWESMGGRCKFLFQIEAIHPNWQDLIFQRPAAAAPAPETPERAHTPGPWIVGYTKDGGDLSVWPAEAATGGKHSIICIVAPPENTTEQDHANAALIAAAPDLLAALAACRAKLEWAMAAGFLENGVTETIIQAERAIETATLTTNQQ